MVGNLTKWVNDWYSATYYSQSPPINPTGPAAGTEHVLRSGSFQDGPDYEGQFLRASGRRPAPIDAFTTVGFQCVRQ
jgi:formylglycine-generating enzyme required for sulfatase activity